MSEEKKEKRPSGFERNKKNYPLMIVVAAMFIGALVWMFKGGC